MTLSQTWLACVLLSLLAWSGQAGAQQRVVKIDDFSPDYRATITTDMKDAKEVFFPGTIEVFDKHSGKRLIEVNSPELAFEVKAGKTAANVRQLPYGEQSVLIYDDFNFDGKKDLAIMDGQNSCYHGPSFQVYLATDHGFRASPDFTRLAQDYCGMFQSDPATRRIHVMTKDGCCSHLFEEYGVAAGLPVFLQSRDETLVQGTLFEYMAITETHGAGKQARTRKSIELDVPDQEPAKSGNGATVALLRFRLAKRSQREVMVIRDPEAKFVDYVLRDAKSGQVEFAYSLAVQGVLPDSERRAKQWADANNDPGNEVYRARLGCAAGSLDFNNAGTHYRVIDMPNRLGVEVTENGRTTFLPGDPATRKGSLKSLQQGKWENVAASTCN
ncbi:XAC2610-related protein [Solilutibacter silvestris]|uniref:VCBS repeat-containing protein n=1 Tax=Solilutibacter silvestris TaxID=1645665 RepID=A0A2K1Q2R3_9GAMM|nr:hypothetical protein [Lysobacter silvestris]PNS09338.1 hypothetical protein Lysil_0967 [Lysobacter silvestris]